MKIEIYPQVPSERIGMGANSPSRTIPTLVNIETTNLTSKIDKVAYAIDIVSVKSFFKHFLHTKNVKVANVIKTTTPAMIPNNPNIQRSL